MQAKAPAWNGRTRAFAWPNEPFREKFWLYWLLGERADFAYQRRLRRHTDLGKDRFEVVAHRVRADVECRGDLWNTMSREELGQDLHLAWR